MRETSDFETSPGDRIGTLAETQGNRRSAICDSPPVDEFLQRDFAGPSSFISFIPLKDTEKIPTKSNIF